MFSLVQSPDWCAPGTQQTFPNERSFLVDKTTCWHPLLAIVKPLRLNYSGKHYSRFRAIWFQFPVCHHAFLRAQSVECPAISLLCSVNHLDSRLRETHCRGASGPMSVLFARTCALIPSTAKLLNPSVSSLVHDLTHSDRNSHVLNQGWTVSGNLKWGWLPTFPPYSPFHISSRYRFTNI